MNNMTGSSKSFGMVVVLACLFGTLVSGCTKKVPSGSKLPYTIADIDGNVSLSTSKFVLTMEGVSYGGHSTSELFLSGSGKSVGSLSLKEGWETTHSYSGKGVCDITFGKAKVQIIDHGRTLVIGGEEHQLGLEKLSFLFKQDGTIEQTKPTTAE